MKKKKVCFDTEEGNQTCAGWAMHAADEDLPQRSLEKAWWLLHKKCMHNNDRYNSSTYQSLQVYKFKFDLQPGSLTDQVAGEHQPSNRNH